MTQTQPQPQQMWDPDLHIPGQGESNIGVTVFLYGSVGTWKTSWAGTWPKPIFLSLGTEGGDDSLALLPHLYSVDTPPVYQITSCKMMLEKMAYILRSYEQYGWKTVVVDSVTFLSDMWIAELMQRKQNLGKKAEMVMRDWGLLEAFMTKDIAQQLHKSKLNVIWIALQREITTANPDGSHDVTGVRPYIQGATATKLPAMCKLIIHADKQLQPDPNNPGRMQAKPIYYTTPSYLAKDVRHKYGNFFPEGKLVDPEHGDWPTFRAIDSRIGQFIYK